MVQKTSLNQRDCWELSDILIIPQYSETENVYSNVDSENIGNLSRAVEGNTKISRWTEDVWSWKSPAPFSFGATVNSRLSPARDEGSGISVLSMTEPSAYLRKDQSPCQPPEGSLDFTLKAGRGTPTNKGWKNPPGAKKRKPLTKNTTYKK